MPQIVLWGPSSETPTGAAWISNAAYTCFYQPFFSFFPPTELGTCHKPSLRSTKARCEPDEGGKGIKCLLLINLLQIKYQADRHDRSLCECLTSRAKTSKKNHSCKVGSKLSQAGFSQWSCDATAFHSALVWQHFSYLPTPWESEHCWEQKNLPSGCCCKITWAKCPTTPVSWERGKCSHFFIIEAGERDLRFHLVITKSWELDAAGDKQMEWCILE